MDCPTGCYATFPVISPVLCAPSHNASVCEGFVPSRWKEANVVPVPKVQPPRAVVSDLRPISLTATLAKVLESFVGSWILERVGDSFDDRQFGALRPVSDARIGRHAAPLARCRRQRRVCTHGLR